MLETKQLQIFKTVVKVGGFTRASQRLNLSQPAASQHVRVLEKELGVALLLRVGKATRLTPAGEVLLQCATQVLDKLDEVQRVLVDHGEGRATIVRLGAPEPACILGALPVTSWPWSSGASRDRGHVRGDPADRHPSHADVLCRGRVAARHRDHAGILLPQRRDPARGPARSSPACSRS